MDWIQMVLDGVYLLLN